ncbi:DUF6734 family protein [Dysgonomonas sp. ZJ709]|uniref:DUF6734 family protein n=1 Tax=Dysgonomonas sp. ZJ709 TaxID=2709797 RepID=UPI0013EADEF0|nr:DUF6734 family protein [Dysgonomonas sp. ZJ709]
MRVVQTLWNGNKDILNDDFGWVSSQYHLMSWALSCLSLKENYEKVVLYTDYAGYNILGKLLKLPYSEIIIQYDNLSCPEHHWAYPKLLTYSLQKKPFIHIDGDVYLPKRLGVKMETDGLIAQNREIGTDYYKNMMDGILQEDIIIPDFLKEVLKKDSIPSYNAGIIGGNDIQFIQKYCRTAFDFIEGNRLNDINRKNVNVNYNILFEQILFYALSEKSNKAVTTVLNHSVQDNGYTYHEFCDFYSYDKYSLMHIIGGHKRNAKICELLGRTLLNKYPEYYERITDLFPAHNKRLQPKETRQLILPNLTKPMGITSYQDYLNNLSIKWKDIPDSYLFDLDKQSCNYFEFLNKSKGDRLLVVIKSNPHLSIYEIGDDWTSETKLLIKEKINKNYASSHFDIACIPCLSTDGLKEVLINDLAYNILILLKISKTFECLFEELQQCFYPEIEKDKSLIYNVMVAELEYLFYNKLIICSYPN